MASGLERFSEHPLARAILDKAQSEGIAPAEAEAFEALPGAGAKAFIYGTTWHIGNPELFTQRCIDLKEIVDSVRDLQEQGKTVVLIGTNKKIIGLIALQDRLRDGMRRIIEDLRATGVRIVMLTGDNVKTARAVARQLGIDDVRADLKPDDKATAIRQLEKQYGAVLMVGDGINDAPALATATCGVAMGVAGSDAAIEAADVALMADDLAKVAEALRLGRKARRVSVQNITFSLLVLAVLIPLAVAGFLSVALAVLFHEVSELLAVANGLRVARFL